MKGSNSAISTQDKNTPITSTATKNVTENLMLRAVDRSPKDRGTFRAAHIAAESIYYPNQSRLFDCYEDVLLDLHLSGIIRKRISQVVNKRLIFKDASGEPVKEMAKIIKTKAFKDVQRQILQAKMWGINGLQFIPGDKLAFDLIPKKHIKRKTQLITYEQFGLDDGIDYTNLKNVWILGEPHDLGLLLLAGYIIMLKKGMISDWAQYIEIFGSPAVVLKYQGYDQSAKLAADNVLKNIGNSMRFTIPVEMNLEFVDGKISNGDGKLQETFRQACNEELSILILGNTETTGHGKNGSGAKSQTHSEQQLEIIKDDMDDICDALNSDHFMDILRSYNLPVDGGYFEFDNEVDIAFITQIAPVHTMLATQMGLEIPKSFMYKTYGIPEPKDGEETIKLFPLLGQQPTTNAPDTQDGQPPAKPKPKKSKKPTPTAELANQLISISANDISAMLDEKLKAFFA